MFYLYNLQLRYIILLVVDIGHNYQWVTIPRGDHFGMHKIWQPPAVSGSNPQNVHVRPPEIKKMVKGVLVAYTYNILPLLLIYTTLFDHPY